MIGLDYVFAKESKVFKQKHNTAEIFDFYRKSLIKNGCTQIV